MKIGSQAKNRNLLSALGRNLAFCRDQDEREQIKRLMARLTARLDAARSVNLETLADLTFGERADITNRGPQDHDQSFGPWAEYPGAHSRYGDRLLCSVRDDIPTPVRILLQK